MASELPSILEIAGPILASVPEAERPLFVAAVERIAARRYRGWAERESGDVRDRLLECADREEEIAARIEALYPDSGGVQAALLAKHPDLEPAYRALFEGRGLADQYSIQAEGERLGASTWRGFAQAAATSAARQTFLDCALLEEESAELLETLAADHVG